MSQPASTQTDAPVSTGEVRRRRLFIGSCVALLSTSLAFAVIGAVTVALKQEFILSNSEVAWVIGANLWGFTITQAIFAPLCDRLGFRALLRVAFGGHLLGTGLMVFAGGFWTLFAGAVVIGMSNGTVEAACNPLVATLYPEQKSVKLNQFHVWFPGGIAVGGAAAFLLDQAGLGFWQLKLGLIAVPTLIYGALMLFDRFPATENVQAGVSTTEMLKATFLNPLMWLLLLAFAITASTELGPNRWVPAVLQAGFEGQSGFEGFVGLGVLILAYINGIMAMLRYYSEATVGRFSPTLILLAGTVVSAAGLLWLSYAQATVAIFLSATLFAVGVAYFWPTMLGLVAERIPRSGALGLGLMGGTGMAVVGLVTTPLMGDITDEYAHEQITSENTQQVVSTFREAAKTYPTMAEKAEGNFAQQIRSAATSAQEVVSTYESTGTLPSPQTANALRAIIDSQVAVESVSSGGGAPLAERASGIIGPADNYGGRVAFRYVVPFTGLLIFIFGGLWWHDRRRGGYQKRSIHQDGEERKEEMEEAQAEARATK